MKKIVILVCWSLAVVQISSTENKDVKLIHPKDRPPSLKIIGGKEAAPHSFPYQVALTIDDLYFCSGTLISKTMVLTAAQCLKGFDSVRVQLGYHKLDEPYDKNHTIVTSTNFKIHEDFDEENNDIAIITLPKAVSLNDNIQVVTLYGGSSALDGSYATASGWGATFSNGAVVNALRYVKNDIMTNEECREFMPSFDTFINERHICLSGVGPSNAKVGVCDKDAGGPLIFNGTQVGLVSYVCSECRLGCPSVFTRISEFKDWIQESCSDCKFSSAAKDLRVGFVIFVISFAIKLFNI